jgi:hypothetical protein
MKLILAVACFALLGAPAWAQRSDGEPSPAVREQQRQADHARKQHPKSAPAPQSKAAVRTPADKKAKPPRSKPGQAAIRTP